MKRMNKVLLVLAMVMLVAAMMIPAWSYFTTYATARGAETIHLGEKTVISEGDVLNWTKPITITNTHDKIAVYVRAKAFCGDNQKLTYSGSGWTENKEDGFWYYSELLEPGDKTENVLNVKIEGVPANDKSEAGDTFNVIVLYESIPARYDADGKPYADWTQELKTVIEEGGN